MDHAHLRQLALTFWALVCVPFAVVIAFIAFAIAGYGLLGSFGLVDAHSFPIWLALPALIVGPLFMFVAAMVVASPFGAVAAGIFYIALRMVANGPVTSKRQLLLVGTCSGLIAGGGARLVASNSSYPLIFLIFGALSGLVAVAVLSSGFLNKELRVRWGHVRGLRQNLINRDG